VREVAAARIEELSEAYMRVAASVYRGHPFYEPAEQVAILRQELAALQLEPAP
jgi:hypothetical protein